MHEFESIVCVWLFDMFIDYRYGYLIKFDLIKWAHYCHNLTLCFTHFKLLYCSCSSWLISMYEHLIIYFKTNKKSLVLFKLIFVSCYLYVLCINCLDILSYHNQFAEFKKKMKMLLVYLQIYSLFEEYYKKLL